MIPVPMDFNSGQPMNFESDVRMDFERTTSSQGSGSGDGADLLIIFDEEPRRYLC